MDRSSLTSCDHRARWVHAHGRYIGVVPTVKTPHAAKGIDEHHAAMRCDDVSSYTANGAYRRARRLHVVGQKLRTDR